MVHREDGLHVAFRDNEQEAAAAQAVIEQSGSEMARSWFRKQRIRESEAESLQAEGPWIVARGTTRRSSPCKTEKHDVHDKPSLFAEFLSLETPDQIVEFASEYGFLFDETYHLVEDASPRPENWRRAEALFEWQHRAKMMRMAWDLWQLLGPGETDHQKEDLKRAIRWSTEDKVCYEPSRTGVRFPISIRPGWVDKFETIPPAQSLLEQIVNDALSRNVQALSLHLDDTGISAKDLVPRNLLGALWLQFLWMLTGRTRPPMKCGYCGRIFTPTTARDLYCKETRDTCKAKAHQVRKMLRDGTPAEEVARRKGVPVSRVRSIAALS